MNIINSIKELSGIITALIGALGVIIVATINGWYQKRSKLLEFERDEAKRKEKKAKIELDLLTLFFPYDFYDYLDDQVEEVFKKTKATRFLVLFAINGKENFNNVTVVYEHTKDKRSKGAIRRYVRLPIDNHYRQVLKLAEVNKSLDLHTEELPKDSLIYQIYSSKEEQVVHSKLKFIQRIHLDDDNDLLLYATIATHDSIPFSDEELYEIKIAVNGIRSKANSIKFQ